MSPKKCDYRRYNFIRIKPPPVQLRSTPFLRLISPFAAGLATGGFADRDLPWLSAAITALLVLTLVLAPLATAHRHRWVFGALVSVLLFGVGYARIVWQRDTLRADHFSTTVGEARWVVGMVYDAPSKGARLKIPLRVEAAGVDSLIVSSGNVLLFVEADSTLGAIRYGDRLAVRAAIRPTEPPRNPEAFDYRRYLHFQNIHYQAFVKSDSVVVLSSGHGWALWRWAFGCRERLLVLLQKHFQNPDEYAVASALLVGYKDDLSDDLRTAYAETGSMHALAVSGTHVGLLYAGLLFLLRRIRWRSRLRNWLQTALVLAVIWAFTFLTGATASVLRASVMFSAFLLGKSLRQDASIWNILAGSAFGLLLYNPGFFFDAGFQLSYAAVAGMVFFYPRLQQITPLWLPGWLDEAWKIFLIGVAAQIGTLPLSLYYFHQFPCYFWLAGWVVVLGGAVFLWGGALLVLFDWLSPVAAGWLGWLLHGLLWGMNQAILLIKDLPGSVVSGVWLPAWGAVLLYGIIAFVGYAIMTRRAKGILIALVLLLVLGAGRLVRSLEQMGQGQLAVYHVSKHTLVDFFAGQQAWSLADSVSAKQVLFAAQANRWAAGIGRVDSFSPEPINAAGMYCHPPFIGFFNLKIALIDDARWLRGQTPAVPVDVLLICQNPLLDISACQRRFPARQIILDASNSWKNTRRWKAECDALGLPCHDVREKGAWVWTKNNDRL